MKQALIMTTTCLLFCASALANTQYEDASKYADSVKGKGMDTLKGTDPSAVIPGYTASPDQSKYYGGTTATSNTALDSSGTTEMNSSEAGKTIQDVIKNRPSDPISTDAPFISGSLDVEDQAETITQGTDTQCKDVDVNKTQITNYTCERTPAVELSCTRTATAGGGHEEDSTEIKQVVIQSQGIAFASSDSGYTGTWTSPVTGRVVTASATYSWNKHLAFSNPNWFMRVTTPFGLISMDDDTGSPALNSGAQLTERAKMAFSIRNRNNKPTVDSIWKSSNMRYSFTITLMVEVPAKKWVPDVVWTEKCPFDKSEQVKTGSICTDPGGDRTFTINGQQYTLHSDCWQYTDTYVSQSADNGTCDTYMKNAACTVASTTCLESLNGTCLRERAVFSCEEKVNGSAQLCGGTLVCADGSCDHLENNSVNDFQSAVSGLAALSAAGKDVSALNGVNVSAFTGKAISCRKAMAGFNNCCKDSGWGQDTGLASCSSEEKALGQAKKRKLTIYVGAYCAHKVLGVCKRHI
ncbi:conjugal transfer protein TraN [Pantoea stewartii]|uniref:conjugal transfer protein TraN n=1 Tax=Pantoea stewartii TaxID=66269 RepID=UPI0012451C47|nr:conjugal transfer protein TraN [Pantoea stewartii]KAB0545788.1 conjugal transfer protein TraN [Pantoea stewartii subsp. stewartii]